MKEKRVYVRVDEPVLVKYKLLDEPNVEARSVSDDISEGGLRFPTNERLRPGSPVELEINIPSDSMPLFGQGIIVWQHKFDLETGKWRFEIGTKFTDMDSFDHKRLLHFLEDHADRH